MEMHEKLGFKLVDHFYNGSELCEQPELEEWYKSSEENKLIYENYRRIWLGCTELAQRKKFNAEIAWTNINKRISIQTTTKHTIQNAVYAAIGMAASLLIILGLAFYTNMFFIRSETIKLSTSLGSRSLIVLPDGTGVTLNAGSHLEYSLDNLNKIRDVKFDGEGYFEVAKSRNPFVIHTPNGLKLKVLGTKFSLTAYSVDKKIKTTLVEGKVELNTPDNKTLSLTPGQMATYDDETKKLQYSNGQVYQNLGWLENKLYLDNTSLQEVCTILERWYNVKITINKDGLGNKIHYTGVLREETIVDVLDALCKLSEIRYQVNGKIIIINSKQLPMIK